MKAVVAGTFTLSPFERGELTTATGIVPVSNPAAWKVAFLTKDGAKWVPLAKPEAPMVAFGGFSSPLTKAQVASLATERKSDLADGFTGGGAGRPVPQEHEGRGRWPPLAGFPGGHRFTAPRLRERTRASEPERQDDSLPGRRRDGRNAQANR